MIKSEADKIAKEITSKWLSDKYSVQPVRTELLETLISAALVDASKVTECAEFEDEG